MAANEQIPTLLVGLGGIGSAIVERVYSRIPADERGRVAMHVLDTNVLDLKDLKYVGTDERTQIGASQQIAEFLLHYPEMNDWFPSDPILNRKSTIEGAGQVRAVSRLGFNHLLHNSASLTKLNKAVDKLFEIRASGGLRVTPRVFITCSLAGGTGAGAFLQTALYLRHLIGERLGSPGGVIVRGFFLLPDTLVMSGTTANNETARLRANALACIKELEGLVAASNTGSPEMELEYKLGGEVSLANQYAYEYSFLFDYQNRYGQSLGSFREYLDQVGRCVHLALFSPLADKQYSQEDNQILELVDDAGRSRYGSGATASLMYPKDEVLAYLARAWAAEDIDSNWLGIDKDFRKEFDQWERDVAQNIYRPEPTRSTHFRRYLSEQFSNDDAAPHYKKIYPQAFMMDEQGKPSESKAEAWLVKILEFIKESIDIDMPSQLSLDGNKLRESKFVKQVVAQAESRIYQYIDDVKRYIPEHVNSLAAQILTRDGEDLRFVKGSGQHRINYWMFEAEHNLHPIAIRYTLYELQEMIGEQRIFLEDKTRKSYTAIQAYEKIYDLPETDERLESASDRVRGALSQPMLKRILGNQLKEFAEVYEQEAQDQYKRVQTYLDDKLTEEVLRKLENNLSVLVSNWESFFDTLEKDRYKLLNEVNKLGQMHEGDHDPTMRFVLASKDAKAALWKDMRTLVAAQRDAVDIYNVAYDRIYRSFCKRNDPEYRARPVNEDFEQALMTTLETRIIESKQLPQNVLEALEREADMADTPRQEHIVNSFKTVKELAHPYLQVRSWSDDAQRQLNFWGLHEDLETTLPNEALREVDAKAQFDAAFNPNEIVYYTVIYGYEATDLAKFNPGLAEVNQPDGVYYTAYRDRIKDVRAGAVTPHLDKRWHDMIPDYWSDTRSVDNSLIQGVALNLLSNVGDTWIYERDRLCSSKTSGHLIGLATAVEARDDIISHIQKIAGEQFLKDQASHPGEVHHHAFIKGLRDVSGLGVNFIDLVADTVNANPGVPLREREDRSVEMFESFCDELRKYVAMAIGDEFEAKRRSFDILKSMATNSILLGSDDNATAVLRNSFNKILDSYAV